MRHALLLSLLLSASLSAQVHTLTFADLQDQEFVDNYYDGGTGSFLGAGTPSGPGPSYGIQFPYQAARATSYLGISGNPTPRAVEFKDTDTTMDVPAGFANGLWLYYTAYGAPITITVWSGTGGTGTLLTTLNLAETGTNCGGTPISCWAQGGIAFTGTARSVTFTVPSGGYVDNLTIGDAGGYPAAAPAATPVPPTIVLSLLGLGSGALYAMRRKRVR